MLRNAMGWGWYTDQYIILSALRRSTAQRYLGLQGGGGEGVKFPDKKT